MPERDPRLEPRKGDRLRQPNSESYREVLGVSDMVHFQVSSTTLMYHAGMASWRKWAKNAEVIHRAT